MDTTKVCTKCKSFKKVSEFAKQKSKKSGLKSHCKTCINIYRQYRIEQISYQRKSHYQENKDRLIEVQRKYRRENVHKLSAYYKNRYQLHRDKLIERIREYRFTNRNELSYKSALRYYMTKHKHIVDDIVLPYESIEQIFTGLNTHTNAN